MKALFTYDYGKEKMNCIRELGYEIILRSEKNIEFDNDMESVEALVCYNPFTTLDISKMKALKWIQVSSIGIDQVPLDYLNENKITLTNNKGGYSIPMGEWIVLKILELLKNSSTFYNKQQQRKWSIDTSLQELYGKTIGFIGTGSIAKEAAKRLQGFGVNINGINTKGTETDYFDTCYPSKEFDNIIGTWDITVVSIPYTRATHHLVNESLLNKMKDNSYIINISRGSIIDESALIDNLKKGKLKGAALDVFEQEPLDSSNLLWSLDNVIITPHNSWVSEMRNERRFNIIYENLKRYISNEPLLNVVNLDKGY